ncbi:MAG: cell division protein FtsX [Caulobacteraceae bacterium]
MTLSADSGQTKWRPAPLLPREPAQDLALVFAVAVLTLFACLAVIAALAADRAAGGWTAELKGSATVIVRPLGGDSPDTAAARAAEVLAGVKGVTEAAALDRAKAEALLKPWLGDDADLSALPAPRLVTVELDRKNPPSPATLTGALRRAGVDAVIDDHSRWVGDIVRAAGTARTAAWIAAVLVGLAAAAVIVFATRAGLAARAQVVEVLHLAGAEDGYIAGLFQWRMALLGAAGGVVGALAAGAIVAGLRMAGGGEGLIPALPVAWSDLAALLPCPVLTAIVAGLAARGTALARLKTE